MADQQQRQKKHPGIWWPQISNMEIAARVARYCVGVGIYLTLFYLSLAILYAMEIDSPLTPYMGDEFIVLGNLIAMTVAAILAIIAYFRSRIAAILILLLCLVELGGMLMFQTPSSGLAVGWGFLLVTATAAALSGVRGAFAYHRFKKARP